MALSLSLALLLSLADSMALSLSLSLSEPVGTSSPQGLECLVSQFTVKLTSSVKAHRAHSHSLFEAYGQSIHASLSLSLSFPSSVLVSSLETQQTLLFCSLFFFSFKFEAEEGTIKLPDQMRQFYRTCNGCNVKEDSEWVHGFNFIPLAKSLDKKGCPGSVAQCRSGLSDTIPE